MAPGSRSLSSNWCLKKWRSHSWYAATIVNSDHKGEIKNKIFQTLLRIKFQRVTQIKWSIIVTGFQGSFLYGFNGKSSENRRPVKSQLFPVDFLCNSLCIGEYKLNCKSGQLFSKIICYPLGAENPLQFFICPVPGSVSLGSGLLQSCRGTIHCRWVAEKLQGASSHICG